MTRTLLVLLFGLILAGSAPAGGNKPLAEAEDEYYKLLRFELPPGFRLPTVRGLAEELGLAPNTVANAPLVTGWLQRIAAGILGFVHGTGSLIAATLATSIGMNFIASDQYIAIVLPGRMFRAEFMQRGLHPKNLSRCLEDSGTVTSALIPWNTCGAQMTTVLGVATGLYWKYAFLNLFCPLVSIAYVGSNTVHGMVAANDINQPVPGPGPNNPRRRFPRFADIRMTLEQNNDVSLARLELDSAREGIRVAEGTFDPRLVPSLSYQRAASASASAIRRPGGCSGPPWSSLRIPRTAAQ